MTRESAPTIGVDVGATTIKAAFVERDGTIMAEAERTTPQDRAAIEDCIVAVVATLPTAGAVGVGTPGWTTADGRCVVYSPNLPWRDEPLAERLEQRLGVPVRLENDANAAAWGEFRFGAGRDADGLVALTLGSGVGGALVVKRALVRGRHGCAGEIGHCVVETAGRPCACGRRGCAENYISGRALQRALAELAVDSTDPAADAQRADEVFAEFGRFVGLALADTVLLVNPDLVVIGGGVADSFDRFGGSATRSLAEALGANWQGLAPPIVPAQLGVKAGRIGSADLARVALTE